MMPIWLYIAAGSALAGAVGGWAVRDAFADSAALKAANRLIAEKDQMQGKIDRQAAGFEAFRQSIDPVRTEATNTIREVYRNVPVPADCALRPDALLVLEAARQRANAAAGGEPGEPLPTDSSRAATRP